MGISFMFDESWPDISMPGMLCCSLGLPVAPADCCCPQDTLASRKSEIRKMRWSRMRVFLHDLNVFNTVAAKLFLQAGVGYCDYSGNRRSEVVKRSQLSRVVARSSRFLIHLTS